MRISGWSSDVCSSDLTTSPTRPLRTMIQGIVRRFSKVGWALRLASSSLTSLTTTHGCSDFSRLIIPEPWPVKRFGKRGSLESNPSAPFGRRQTRCSLIAEERSEEHTSELQSLMRISYAVFCLKTKNRKENINNEQYECNNICNMIINLI